MFLSFSFSLSIYPYLALNRFISRSHSHSISVPFFTHVFISFLPKSSFPPNAKIEFFQKCAKGKIDFTAITKYTRWTIFTNRNISVANNRASRSSYQRLTRKTMVSIEKVDEPITNRTFAAELFGLATLFFAAPSKVIWFGITYFIMHWIYKQLRNRRNENSSSLLHIVVVGDVFDDVHKVGITFSFLASTLSMPVLAVPNKQWRWARLHASAQS